jgi:hypothetical protein
MRGFFMRRRHLYIFLRIPNCRISSRVNHRPVFRICDSRTSSLVTYRPVFRICSCRISSLVTDRQVLRIPGCRISSLMINRPVFRIFSCRISSRRLIDRYSGSAASVSIWFLKVPLLYFYLNFSCFLHFRLILF